jgi:hypothetical protein
MSMVLAFSLNDRIADQRQAGIGLGYVEVIFRGSAVLCQIIEAHTQRMLNLTNKIDVEVRGADFRRLRGPTYIAVIPDKSERLFG